MNKKCPLYPPIPPLPVNSSYRVTLVDQMTVDETAMWIWTCFHFFGCEEAQRYSISFKENCIWGELLPMLTVELMKDDLHINNPLHRSYIKSIIDHHFPDIEKKEHVERGVFPAGPKFLKCQQESKFIEGESESDYISIGDCCSNSDINSESDNTRSSISFNSCRSSMNAEQDAPLRKRQLILRLQPEELAFPALREFLYQKFAERNYIVDIHMNRDSCVVEFEDRGMALKALAEANVLGLKLSKRRPKRPSPDRLVRFKALHELQIREGKSPNQKKKGKVKKDEIIIVNQVKGRRARIVDIQDGKPVNIGWVSLNSKEGITLLQRVEEVNE